MIIVEQFRDDYMFKTQNIITSYGSYPKIRVNLPEDHIEFEMATNASKMHSVLWELDQWLRAQYKYMSDAEYSEDKYETFDEV